ncbi:MAG: DUF4321 domain-containing protein [Ruminococcus sp.]|nr:DUF4321 domain-containing protein [Ruminococcus sp.]
MKRFLLMTVLVLAAILLGGFVGDICMDSAAFDWLAYSKSFSYQPGTIDIVILTITFGFSITINIAQLIFIFVALFAYYKIAPKFITEDK